MKGYDMFKGLLLSISVFLFACQPVFAQTTIPVGADINAIVQAAPAGETFIIETGVHRQQTIVPKTNQVFIGEDGAVLSGAKVVSNWTQGPNFWSSHGHTENGQVHGICEEVEVGTACQYPEDLFKDNTLLQQVVLDPVTPANLQNGQPGTWFFDYENDIVYVFDDPTNSVMELASSRWAFTASETSHGVTIKNLTVEKYATPAQHGAIHALVGTTGTIMDDWIITENTVQYNHGCGIKLGNRSIVSHNKALYNGQMGICGKGDDVQLLYNEIAYNNTAFFSMDWEAGGTKFVQTARFHAEGNYVHNNRGPGLWTDIDNSETVYYRNFVSNNFRAGIFHEISQSAEIYENVTIGNGFGLPNWIWGSGILVAASSDVEIHHNYVFGNADGIAGAQQDRGPGREITNLYVHHNWIQTDEGGQTGLDADFEDTTLYMRNNVFDYNSYILAGVAPFIHDTIPHSNGNVSESTWVNTFNMDVNGSFYREVTP